MGHLEAAAAKSCPESAALGGCLTLDRTGAIAQMSAELERLFGYKLNELKGRPLAALLGNAFRERLGSRFTRFFAGLPGEPPPRGLALAAVTKQNGEIPIRMSLYRAGLEEAAAFVATVESRIESRPEGPQAVRDSGEGHALAARLLREREERGRGLARLVHRKFAQEVAMAKLNLLLLRRSPLFADPDIQDRLDRIEQGLANAATSAQELCEGLYPPELDDLGLTAALRALAARVSEASGIEVRTAFGGEAPDISPEQAIGLYRIVEEAVWNAVRHSRAEVVTVSDRSSSNRVRMEIRDEGAGFSLARIASPAGGLIRIHKLADLVQATCRIDTRPGGGTTVIVEAVLGGRGT